MLMPTSLLRKVWLYPDAVGMGVRGRPELLPHAGGLHAQHHLARADVLVRTLPCTPCRLRTTPLNA